MDARFLAYLAVAAVLIVTPGPDMALVARNAVRGGARAARASAWGVGTGILGWGLCSALGLAALLRESASLFAFLKLAGALFLVALGLRSLLAAARRTAAPDAAGPSRPAPLAARDAYVQGLVGNLLNPKAGVIFVAIVPQFIGPADGPARIAAMTLAFVVMVASWLAVYGTAVARAATHFGPRVRRALDGASGAVMVALGARLAVERG